VLEDPVDQALVGRVDRLLENAQHGVGQISRHRLLEEKIIKIQLFLKKTTKFARRLEQLAFLSAVYEL